MQAFLQELGLDEIAAVAERLAVLGCYLEQEGRTSILLAGHILGGHLMC